MDLEAFLKSIDVLDMTALVSFGNDSALKTRGREVPDILAAFSPVLIKSDVSRLRISGIPGTANSLAHLREIVTNSVYSYARNFSMANAFHLSFPRFLYFSTNRELIQYLECFASFYRIDFQ